MMNIGKQVAPTYLSILRNLPYEYVQARPAGK